MILLSPTTKHEREEMSVTLAVKNFSPCLNIHCSIVCLNCADEVNYHH